MCLLLVVFILAALGVCFLEDFNGHKNDEGKAPAAVDALYNFPAVCVFFALLLLRLVLLQRPHRNFRYRQATAARA